VVVLFLAIGLPAWGGGVLDQECDGGSAISQDIFSGGFFAQTFTAGLRGSLTAVAVRLYAEDGLPGAETLTVEIRGTTVGDVPTAEVLGSATIAASVIVDFDFAVVSFAPGEIEVSAGTVYAIVLRTDHPWTAGANFGSNGGLPGTTYAGGDAWQSDDGAIWTLSTAAMENYDRHFRTWVDPYVPQDPDAAMVAVLAQIDADIAGGAAEPWLKTLQKVRKSAQQALDMYRANPNDYAKVIKTLSKVIKAVVSAMAKGYPDSGDLVGEIGWSLGLNLATLALLYADDLGPDAALLAPAEDLITSGNGALTTGAPLTAMNDYAKSAKISLKVRKTTR
jgi:hypothetical protein